MELAGTEFGAGFLAGEFCTFPGPPKKEMI
jgi:hypothetical protein